LLAGFDDADVTIEIPGIDYVFMGIENFGITQGRRLAQLIAPDSPRQAAT
jgi:hypothetical protein